MSKKLVLDSFALVSLFHKEPGWEKVRAALYEQQRAGAKALLNWVNLGRVLLHRQTQGGRNAGR